MFQSLSMTFSNALGFLVPTLIGTLFFFTIIGVFGIWFAIGGLVLAVVVALAMFSCIPAEGDTR